MGCLASIAQLLVRFDEMRGIQAGVSSSHDTPRRQTRPTTSASKSREPADKIQLSALLGFGIEGWSVPSPATS